MPAELTILRAPAPKASGKRTLLLLALVCALPVLASYAALLWWRPAATVNHGALLAPAVLALAPLQDGAAVPDLNGKWTLIYVGPAPCAAACEHLLWLSRQVRTAQGKEMDRVGRLWLVSGGAAPRGSEAGLALARSAAAAGAPLETGLYLADPRGRVMLSWGTAPEPQGVLKDLARLLKYSGLR